jgi:hypothetical protein
MPRYIVTWNDVEKTVEAENEADAWAEYAKGYDLAMRCPHLHEREIEEYADQVDFI